MHLMKVMNMTRSSANFCLFIKKNDNNEVVLLASVHVDDTMLAGRADAIH